MSTERKRSSDAALESLDDRDIATYLSSHPDFFERHSGLLAYLKLPHDAGVNTVSLIERQVAILREKNRKLDQKLRELLGVARANDVLAAKMHKLAIRLIVARTTDDVLSKINRSLTEDLGSDRFVIFLFKEAKPSEALNNNDQVRIISKKQNGLDLFQSFLNNGKPRCGQVKGAKREFLFGSDDGAEIESAALIPLGAKTKTGFVAIGSRNSGRFHPGMSTDFLARLGELIDRGLASAS